MASRHMPSEPQEVISKKTIMKEAEKPGQGRWPCAAAAAKGGPVSRATRRGWQADPCGKTHDTVGIGRFLERKEDKIRR